MRNEKNNSDEHNRIYSKKLYNIASVYDHIIRIRMRYFNDVKGAILDHGFGNGVLCDYFNSEGFDVYGVESSDTALEDIHSTAIERNLQADQFKIMEHDAHQLPFSDGFFNTIISNQVLYFLQNRHQIDNLILDFFRVLHSGGKIAITVMAEDNFYFTKYGIPPIPDKGLVNVKVRGRIERDFSLYRFRDENDLRNCFEQAGFIVDDLGFFDYQLLDVEKAKHYILLAHKP